MEMEHEIINAQERLIRMREEANQNREDSAYPTSTSPKIYQILPKTSANETLNVSRNLPADRVRVEYIKGVSLGLRHILRKDIAEELIRTGFAREIR